MVNHGLWLRGQVWACVLVVLLAGCGKQTDERAVQAGSQQLSVYTVNYPLKYFAERIGGDLVDVQFPAPADEDPAYWSPDTDAVAAYQKADLILLNGADYAKWVSKVSLPAAKMVDTGKAIADRFIELEEHVTHSHGPGGKHAHGGFAFTTWLDPQLAVEQARAVKDTLGRKLPDSRIAFAERFTELEKDLLEMDKQINDLVLADPKRPLVFSHPVYQYFERRYDLNSRSVHWEPDEAPSEEMWTEFTELLKKHPATWMVWEGDPDPTVVEKLKGLGVWSVVFDPCGATPDEGDLLFVMRRNIDNLKVVYERQ